MHRPPVKNEPLKGILNIANRLFITTRVNMLGTEASTRLSNQTARVLICMENQRRYV